MTEIATARDRLAALFEQARRPEAVVCLHTWGEYPFEALGKGELWGRSRGIPLAEVYEEFWHAFPSDWLHVCEPAVDPPSKSDLGYHYAGDGERPVDITHIDSWMKANWDGLSLSAKDITRSGAYAHVTRLRETLGREVMIFPNQEAPATVIPALGWERQMTLALEQPDLVEHFVRTDCRRFLEWVKAARNAGADGFIFSEGYGGAVDLLPPHLFEEVFLEAKTEFYAAVRAAGLLAIGYFLGDVMPYLELINRIAPDGVMVEEGKKGFTVDVVEIRKQLKAEIVLFGNLDSQLLLDGCPDEIWAEVRRQARALDYGPFAFANGSPICPHTPPDNLRAFLQAARGIRNVA